MGREPLYPGQALQHHSVELLATQWAALGDLARQGHTSRSAVLREALDAFIAWRRPAPVPERDGQAVVA